VNATGKRIKPSIFAALLLIMFIFREVQVTNAQPTARIKVINPTTEDFNFTFFTNVTREGTRFNATILIFNVSNLFSYQVHLFYNQNMINATRAWIPKWDSEWVFYGKNAYILGPVFAGEYINDTYYNYVQLGSVLLSEPAYTGEKGLLAIIEFEIIASPEPNNYLETELNIDNPDTILLKDPSTEIPAEKVNGKYRFNWLEPTLSLKPCTQVLTRPYETFNLTVWIENVTESDKLVAISFTLAFNRTLLNITKVDEGPFFPSFNSTPTPPYTQFTYKLTPEGINITTKLKPGPEGYTRFPKGSGVLVNLRFQLIHQPPNRTYCPLQLTNITALNSEGTPTITSPPKDTLIIIATQNQPVLLITVKPKTAPIKSRISIAGILFPPENQIEISIYIRSKNGKWNNLTNLMATNGSFLFNWTATDAGSFELKANCTKAESNIETLTITKIATQITIDIAPTVVQLNFPVTIHGQITVKSKINITIYYRKIGQSFQKLTAIESDHEGNYHYEWTPKTPGTYEVYSYWAGNTTHDAAKSQKKIVVIEKYNTSITLNVSSSTVTLNSKVIIIGTITPPRPNLEILIFYREVNSSSLSKIIVSTKKDGSFATEWIASKNATFEFYAWWKGDEYSKPSSSSLVTIKVNEKTTKPQGGGPNLFYVALAITLTVAGTLAALLYYRAGKKKTTSARLHKTKIRRVK